MKKKILILAILSVFQAQAVNYLKIRNLYKKPLYVYIITTSPQNNKSFKIEPGLTSPIMGDLDTITSLSIKTDFSLKEYSLRKELATMQQQSRSKENDIAWILIDGTTFSWKTQVFWENNLKNYDTPQRPTKSAVVSILNTLKNALEQNKYAVAKKIIQQNSQLFTQLDMNIQGLMNPMNRDNAVVYLQIKIEDLSQ